MINENIQILKDTLSALKNGKYYKDGKAINTKLSVDQMEECYVYLPDKVSDISNRKDFDHVHVIGRVGVGCYNIDSFSMAQYQYKTFSCFLSKNKDNRVLVLNFANPVNPGGGVRRGCKSARGRSVSQELFAVIARKSRG